MNISKRLILTLAVALLALLFVGSIGLWRLNQAQQRFEYVQVNILPSIQELNAAKFDASAMRTQGYHFFSSTDDTARAAARARIAELDKSFDTHMATYERDDISDDTDRKLLEADKADMAAFRNARKAMTDQLAGGDTEGARKTLTGDAMVGAANTLFAALDAHVAYNNKLSQGLRSDNDSAYHQAFWLLMLCMAAAFIVTALLGTRLYHLISSGLSKIQRTLQHVSQSLDLTDSVQVERMDEIGKTATAFNVLLTRVAEVVSNVRNSADSVSVATREIAAGNVDLSSRTEQQAASLEETAASMEQLTTTVRQNTDSARQASTLALSASEISDQGNQVVGRMVETMAEITSSSGKIAEITALIEGIAFQTNILALNAAVEAARAGEQGRGFAVVASEVRNLAQRSSVAAKDIKDLIEKSVATIQTGSSQAAEVGRTTEEARQAVRRVADIIGEISAASEEQGRGIEQVNQAVTQMDEVTQQNAALVEQAAAAAQSLEEQALKLNQMVSVFTVAHSADQPAAQQSARQPTAPRRDAARPSAARHVGRPQASRSAAHTAAPAVAAAAAPAPALAHGAGDWETF